MSEKDRFVGTWRLVSAESSDSQGKPVVGFDDGILQYTSAGRMSVQLRQSNRPRFAGKDWFSASEAEMKSALTGFAAYFGTFTVDEASGIVVHRIQGCFFPNWEGGEQQRYYRFDGDRLVLSTTPGVIADEKARAMLVWERLE